ncbi:ATP cone domain-containing protein [Thermogladius sp.]|uniref:ATP cone domain-containing protein n=1 Tax=Thermogladius sp. TaxID=2023064 RepID=UPI003D13DD35
MSSIFVIKRDGSKEEFIPEKIVVSIIKTGAPVDVARRIAKIVEGKLLEQNVTEISSKDLMKMVLDLLKRENEEWYRNWIIFDKAVKRRRPEA